VEARFAEHEDQRAIALPSEMGATGKLQPVNTQPVTFSWSQFAGHSLFDQIKTILALIGLVAIVVRLTQRRAA
jgi:hypothetical protein